jgi:hypothetical protein
MTNTDDRYSCFSYGGLFRLGPYAGVRFGGVNLISEKWGSAYSQRNKTL